jgi:hypothetical protein
VNIELAEYKPGGHSGWARRQKQWLTYDVSWYSEGEKVDQGIASRLRLFGPLADVPDSGQTGPRLIRKVLTTKREPYRLRTMMRGYAPSVDVVITLRSQ